MPVYMLLCISKFIVTNICKYFILDVFHQQLYKLNSVTFLLFLKILSVYLKGRAMYRGNRKWDIDLPSASLLPKCLQQPGLSQAEARSPEFHPAFPGVQVPVPSLVLPGALTGTWIGTGTPVWDPNIISNGLACFATVLVPTFIYYSDNTDAKHSLAKSVRKSSLMLRNFQECVRNPYIFLNLLHRLLPFCPLMMCLRLK